MPYADNGNVRIHYQVEGEGPALVLQHGFTESVVDWYEAGYVEALRPDYRLILIDARGHGVSDKPHVCQRYLRPRPFCPGCAGSKITVCSFSERFLSLRRWPAATTPAS